MQKRILPIILILCFMFSISALAREATRAVDTQSSPTYSSSADNGQNGFGSVPNTQQNNNSNAPDSGRNGMGGNSQFGGFGNSGNSPENGFFGNRGGFSGNMQNGTQNGTQPEAQGFAGFVKEYSTPIASVILLAIAYAFVLLYKRKHY